MSTAMIKWFERFFTLFLFGQFYSSDYVRANNNITNGIISVVESENFVYISVPNLSQIDLGFVFVPAINGLPFQTLNAPGETQYFKPVGSIGYEIPCGVRGVNISNAIKIVGGTNARVDEFPWQASIQRVDDRSALHVCGGAVISSSWIVTAAHCVVDWPTSSLSVVVGDYNLFEVEGHEQRVKVVKIVTQGYVKGKFSKDIALLQIHPPLPLDGVHISPICIPEPYHKFEGLGIVTGWGRLAENGAIPHILQKVTLPIINNSRCRRWFLISGYRSQLPRECQLCSGREEGGLDSCQGDSGGPLVCKRSDGHYYLCGIVSWGIGCARPLLPGVYTEVACYSSWIRQIIYGQQ